MELLYHLTYIVRQRLPRACLRPPPWRRLGGRSRACRWRGRPSSAWRRRCSALVYPISGVTRATAASATARTRAAPPRAMSRHQKPFAVAVARHALLVCAWPPMDGAFLGLAPTHIPCATLMNANFICSVTHGRPRDRPDKRGEHQAFKCTHTLVREHISHIV